MRVKAPTDPDWYLDHVLVVGERGRNRVGPSRTRQGEWLAAVRTLAAQHPHGPRARATAIASRQGLVLRRDQAVDCGLTPGALRGLVRRGEWSAPRYGVVSPLPERPPDAVTQKWAAAVAPHGGAVQVRAAAVALVRRELVVSHESAAAMHGLPTLTDRGRPTLSASHESRAAGRTDALIRCVGMRPDETTTWFGAPVTTVPRTVIDIARCSGVAAGLVAADAALHDGLTTPADLATTRAYGRYRPGVRHADRVLELADGDAESPLETLVRLCLVDGGLRAPKLQRVIHTHRGDYRVDMLYEAERVIIEADGELKYRGDDPDALVREKRRQEALARAGYVVVRVSWSEVWTEPAEVVDRVRRALAAAGR